VATSSCSHPPAGRGGKKSWARTRRRRKYVNDVAATLGRAMVADCNTAVAAADGRWSACAKIIKSKTTTTNPLRAPRTMATTTAMGPRARPHRVRVGGSRGPRSRHGVARAPSSTFSIILQKTEYYYNIYIFICLKIKLVRACANVRQLCFFFGIRGTQCLPDNKQYFFFLLFTQSTRPFCTTRVNF